MLYDGTLIFLVVAVFRVVVVVGTGGKRGGFSWWEGKENVIIHIDAVQCIIRFPCPLDSFWVFFRCCCYFVRSAAQDKKKGGNRHRNVSGCAYIGVYYEQIRLKGKYFLPGRWIFIAAFLRWFLSLMEEASKGGLLLPAVRSTYLLDGFIGQVHQLTSRPWTNISLYFYFYLQLYCFLFVFLFRFLLEPFPLGRPYH